jgi:CPA2 family monovalent cation:H+ antiporter-2
MEGHAALIETIAIGLGAAFVGGFGARRLGLPPIVGYLVAGILVGPFTPGLVADTATAQELAELGIILLMFGVGIEFSIADLLAVRRIAVPGAVGQSAVATVLGTFLGLALGWGLGGGIVLGLAISVASTVVLLRALEERGELDTEQGRIAIGWLIVEDLFTVLVLVLLPSLAPLIRGEGGASPVDAVAPLAIAIGKAAVFSVLMLVVGTRVVPRVLDAVARERSRELFTLSVLAIAIGIAFVAAAGFGVSYALGAFFAGIVLAESAVSHHAAANALPLRDAFAVLFFVSVGMLVDPGYIAANPLAVLAVTALVVFAKSAAALVIVGLSGYPIRTGLTVAAALAQVGEFSFILATVGLSLELIPEAAFQLVVAASLVSITLNPVAFRVADAIDARLRDRPDLRGRVERGAGVLATLPERDRDEGLRGHAIVCGYGRVGRMIIGALERRGFRYVVVSSDRREVEGLRERDIRALFGDAANPEILREAQLGRARVVIVAIADPHAARLIVDRVRELAPRVPLVVRTHSGGAAVELRAMGPAVQAVYTEGELAVQMTRFSLRRFGLSSTEVEAIAQGLRTSGGAEPGVSPGRPPAGPGRAERWRARLRTWLETRARRGPTDGAVEDDPRAAAERESETPP